MKKIGPLLMAAPPGIVNHSGLRNKYDSKSQQPYASAQINVFIIKKKLFVESSSKAIYLAATKHEHAANPVRENAGVANHIITTSAPTACFADYL